MDAATKVRITVFGVMVAAILALVLALAWNIQQHQKQVTQLQNDLAEKDKTIEVQKGLYTKLALQTQNVQGTLDQRDAQVKELTDQIKKQKQEILDATQLTLTWKKAYEGLANATETHVDPPKGQPATAGREKVDFHEDFGAIKVDGWTLTNPPQAWVRLSPGKPLKLTLAISQDASKAWHTYATSSDPNIGVDIAVTAVNPYVLQPHWYENIGVVVDLGAGTNQSGVGALLGVGLNYRFLQFSLGPHVWLAMNSVVDKYYGLSFEWRPFQRK